MNRTHALLASGSGSLGSNAYMYDFSSPDPEWVQLDGGLGSARAGAGCAPFTYEDGRRVVIFAGTERVVHNYQKEELVDKMKIKQPSP